MARQLLVDDLRHALLAALLKALDQAHDRHPGAQQWRHGRQGLAHAVRGHADDQHITIAQRLVEVDSGTQLRVQWQTLQVGVVAVLAVDLLDRLAAAAPDQRAGIACRERRDRGAPRTRAKHGNVDRAAHRRVLPLGLRARLGVAARGLCTGAGRTSPGHRSSVSTNIWRTSSTRRSRFSMRQSTTEIGGSTATCTVPARMVWSLRPMISPALRITTGTIGTAACMAMWKAPFLNLPTRGVHERVPSGAITTLRPRVSRSTAGLSASIALAVLLRSRKA